MYVYIYIVLGYRTGGVQKPIEYYRRRVYGLRDVKCNNPRLKSFYTSRRRRGRRVIRLPGTTSFTTRYRFELGLGGFSENDEDPLSIASNDARGRLTDALP